MDKIKTAQKDLQNILAGCKMLQDAIDSNNLDDVRDALGAISEDSTDALNRAWGWEDDPLRLRIQR